MIFFLGRFFNFLFFFFVKCHFVDLSLDDGPMGGRTRSLDSLEPDDDEERETPIKKKKHRSFEDSSDTGKKSEKVKKRQHMDKDSTESKGVMTYIRNSAPRIYEYT